MKPAMLLWGSLLAVASAAANADGALRIKCFDDAEGAEVYINGQFKTNCPASVFVPVGEVRILIRKNTDADHERVFTQQMRIGEGAVATVEAKLSAPQLTADASRRKQIAEARQTLDKAQAGDINAMREMSDRYSKGLGVDANAAQARDWLQKAEEATAQQLQQKAEAGNPESMEALAARYDTGNGVPKDPAKASFWRDKKQALLQQQQAQKKAVDKQARINALEAQQFSMTKEYFADMSMQNPAKDNPSSATLLTIYSPLFVPTSLLSDLSKLPGQKAEIEKIRQEAAVLPATWGAPASMLARAAQRNADHAETLASNDK